MKRTFPIHGIIGIVVLVLSQILLFEKTEPIYSWFYCFAWWSYIFALDGIIYTLKGNSLILSRTREFFLMIPWSVFFWLIFEAANLSLQNWYYINLPSSRLERWAGYFVAYGTVLPGLFETMELLETVGFLRNVRTRTIGFTSSVHAVLMLLGVLSLVLSLLAPYYFFCLIWVGFILLLEPINYRYGERSLLKDLETGNPRKIYLLLISGLICGLLWEFWNFWARSKWIYTVPFFQKTKGFEMPVLGFLGFPPFAMQVYVMYTFLSLFRSGRGWEESTYRIAPERRTRRVTVLLTVALITAFSVLVFREIDLHTVDSYEVRLEDAYWIPLKWRTELPRVGITSLDELLAKTKTNREVEELALRLLVPKEELTGWIEKAELSQLKGLGTKNLRLLEGVGIHSVASLAAQDIEALRLKMREQYSPDLVPTRAKIRIWIREAQRHVRGKS
jgi:hypothetical protein